MKFVADEHISPRIVRAVREIALRRGWTLGGVRDGGYHGRPDEDWVSQFAGDGGNVVLSADRRMLKRPTMIAKMRQLQLVGVYLPAEWAGRQRHYQAAHILYWWPMIEACAESAPLGSIWLVPKGLAGGDIREHVPKLKRRFHAK